ncbi:MAG: hypothetical protein SPJ83_01730 [Helicobacter sp.]|uniref:hypothetical protein n=1 Tax=Helicobacter sp. TaxID=218 RepID=UPI002A91D3B6|nr:hypothetical protein [Helicobacter sp.]MDY5821507.1 hypothetical protein [Helicobacter sp.]
MFDILRKEILALDENITEKINMRFIAYKLNTSIVDIVPQKNGLKLFLHIDIFTLQDEKK